MPSFLSDLERANVNKRLFTFVVYVRSNPVTDCLRAVALTRTRSSFHCPLLGFLSA